MKKRVGVLLGVVLGVLLSGTAVAAGKVTGGVISQHPGWFKESFLDIGEDVEEAAAEGRHVILFMHLNGCPYCNKMSEENFKQSPDTGYIRQHFDVIAINIKGDREVAFNEEVTLSEKALADQVGVNYTPTTVFLNQQNQVVLKLNGYRSVEKFGHALRYVQQKKYTEMTLADYIEQQAVAQRYRLRSHPLFSAITDLSSVNGPLALLFEDSGCDACDTLHDGHLSNPAITQVLEQMTVVRLDANATTPIVDAAGNRTTPKAYAKRLGLTYRPGIVLFDKGKEIQRIDGLLYSYHFQEVLRYVAERHYEQYPADFYQYLGARTRELLNSGVDIDLSK
jgi:thioredoxin-related protein